MRFSSILLGLLLFSLMVAAAGPDARLLDNGRAFPTCSIVARDTLTGKMGVLTLTARLGGAATPQFGVPDTLAGVCQGTLSRRFFPFLMACLRRGEELDTAIDKYLRMDPAANFRQLLVTDNGSHFIFRTGSEIKRRFFNSVSTEIGMAGFGFALHVDPVPVAAAYRGADSLKLAERLLHCARLIPREESHAGSLVIWSRGAGPDGATGKAVDLRVDFAADPLAELESLLKRQRGQEEALQAWRLALSGNYKAALARVQTAQELFPENRDFHYLEALIQFTAGAREESRRIFRELLPRSTLLQMEFAHESELPRDFREAVLKEIQSPQ